MTTSPSPSPAELSAGVDDTLAASARSAYERARAVRGVRGALVVVPVAIAGLALGTAWPLAMASCAVAFAIAAVALWRGEGFATGVVPGVVIGAVPVVAAGVAAPLLGVCGDAVCNVTCLVGTLTGGAWFGFVFARKGVLLGGDGARALVSAAPIAAVLAPLGCLAMGIGGSVGLVVGLTVGGVPGAVAGAVARRA